KWDVTVRPAGVAWAAAREQKTADRAAKQQQQDREDEQALLRALDDLDPHGTGVSYNQAQEVAQLSDTRMTRAVGRLANAGALARGGLAWTIPFFAACEGRFSMDMLPPFSRGVVLRLRVRGPARRAAYPALYRGP